MFGWFRTKKSQYETVLSHLKDFEMFCMGKMQMTPEEFREINIALSTLAIAHIGRQNTRKLEDGEHLIWTGPDNREYDLGHVNSINVSRDYPGFSRACSLSLGHDMVVDNEVVEIPFQRRMVSVVKMVDGSTGIAPNYRMALRNAALKMHLKHEFNRHNLPTAWDQIYGHA